MVQFSSPSMEGSLAISLGSLYTERRKFPEYLVSERQDAEHRLHWYLSCVLGKEKQIYMYGVTTQAGSGKIYKKLLIALVFGREIELEHKNERKIYFSLCILCIS